MKKTLFIIFCFMVFSINSYAQSILSLEGTSWIYVGNNDEVFIGQIEFKNNGRVLFIDRYGNISNGDWFQNEDQLIFSISEHNRFIRFPIFTYYGKISENNIVGIANTDNNGNDISWDFKMERI